MWIFTVILIIVSLSPFAGAIGLSCLANITAHGPHYKHILWIFIISFYIIGIGVHTYGPMILYDNVFSGMKKFILFIAPLITALVICYLEFS